jgi:hypothetical protein
MSESITTITLPALPDGHFHAGLILKEDGTPDYWLVGLPGELDAADWQTAMDWAKEQGGDLPSLRELNLLRANSRQHFKDDWYWSNQKYSEKTAFGQDFYDGDQDNGLLSSECRVRAVSRFPAQ